MKLRGSVFQHVLEFLGPATDVGFYVVKDWLLVEVKPNHVGYVGADGFVVGNSGTRSIDDGDVAGEVGRHQAGNAEQTVVAEAFRLRVQKSIIEPAVNYVYG